MEPVFMVLAQSAATAAIQVIDKGISVQQVDVALLQKVLKENPLANGTTREILIDNDDKANVTMIGSWTTLKNAPGCYGPSLLSSAGGDKARIQSVKFSTLIEKEGSYEVYTYFPNWKKKLHTGSKTQPAKDRRADVRGMDFSWTI
jgi:hypothetical protein